MTLPYVVACGWCQAKNVLPDADTSSHPRITCHACGHRADLPRSACDCPNCRKPGQITPSARQRLREYVASLGKGGAK